MKVQTYSAKGSKKDKTDLPSVFNEFKRTDLIERAFHSERSKKFQNKGAYSRAGLEASAESYGPGAGRSRVPRIKAGPRRSGRSARGHKFRSKGRWFSRAMEGAVIPGTRGGRQAHPPKSQENIIKDMNKKELKKAYRCALSMLSDKKIVEKRGHEVNDLDELPIIVDDSVSDSKKTKNVESLLKKLGLEAELERTNEKKIRAGKGKSRGRKYKKPKGALFILHNDAENLAPFSNIPGVDAVTVSDLSIEMLAPGAQPGRLTIITKSALSELEERFE